MEISRFSTVFFIGFSLLFDNNMSFLRDFKFESQSWLMFSSNCQTKKDLKFWMMSLKDDLSQEQPQIMETDFTSSYLFSCFQYSKVLWA